VKDQGQGHSKVKHFSDLLRQAETSTSPFGRRSIILQFASVLASCKSFPSQAALCTLIREDDPDFQTVPAAAAGTVWNSGSSSRITALFIGFHRLSFYVLFIVFGSVRACVRASGRASRKVCSHDVRTQWREL